METTNKIIQISIFSIAMAFLETAVVVYLRILYFPKLHQQVLVEPNSLILITELGRELSTIIMLYAAAFLCSENKAQRFGFFVYSFAIWDLFYYVFLKLLLNWPSSILDWDLLFLLPVPWIGPVLAPCITSISMIILAACVLLIGKRNTVVHFTLACKVLLTIGFTIIILSFINYSVDIAINFLLGNQSNFIIQNLKQFIPTNFNWLLFGSGQTCIIMAIGVLYYKNKVNNTYTLLGYDSEVNFI